MARTPGKVAGSRMPAKPVAPGSGPASNARVAALLSPDSSELVMRAAGEVARRTHADLLGLFLEDIELLHLAGMPMAREVCFPCATLRDFDTARMERMLRTAGERARFSFDLITGARSRTFRVTRGDWLDTLLEAATQADIVVAGVARPGVVAGVARPGSGAPQRTQSIIALGAGTQPRGALDALVDMARAQNLALNLVLLGNAGEDWEVDLGRAARLFRAAGAGELREIVRQLAHGSSAAG